MSNGTMAAQRPIGDSSWQQRQGTVTPVFGQLWPSPPANSVMPCFQPAVCQPVQSLPPCGSDPHIKYSAAESQIKGIRRSETDNNEKPGKGQRIERMLDSNKSAIVDTIKAIAQTLSDPAELKGLIEAHLQIDFADDELTQNQSNLSHSIQL